ncbi:COPII coat complex component secretory 31 isoform X2 [Tachypleus tridentatus]
MKVKEIDRTANIAWSPAAHHPIYIAAGTAAQQLDATFSTTAALEIYGLNLTEPGLDMSLKGNIVSDYRFHKIVWGSGGMSNGEHVSGVLVGGADGGNLLAYDPAKLLKGESALICHRDKHTGPINSLDFNNFQPNLLASGAAESEIFIWDLNNPNTPMTPGAKSQPAEVVTCVAWNRQVQHILASTFSAKCVVWDLRKNEPIIKVSDTTSRIRCKVVSWHPEVATQLCLASEDDHSPVIQLWDLRFATSPLKTLEHHQRGILSIAWCPQDPDLLLSCGKDNKILCWNPNSNIQDGEVVCELPTSDQWSFDVSWCPRNPAVIASSSFDGHVSVYSLMGGQQQIQPSSKLAESFPGSDAFAQPPVQQSTQYTVSVSLKKPPKWLRKPVGASFGFGGRLVTFVHELPQPHHGQPGHPVPPIHQVYISQIVTEPEVLNRATQLESALNTSNLADFCHKKVQAITDSYKQLAWNFLQANFDQSPRASMLSLLGYDPQDVNMQINTMIKKNESKVDSNENSVDDDMSNKISSLSTDVAEGDEGSLLFDNIASKEENVDLTPMTIKTDKDDIDGMLSRALLTGNVAAAVQLCLKDERWADAIILAQAGGQSLLHQTQKCYFKAMHSDSVKLISAVVTSDWNHVVDHCDIDCWKEALAAVLAYAKPEEFTVLCETLGGRLEAEQNRVMIQNAMLCYICAGNYEKLANCWVRTQNKIDSPDSLQELVEQVMVLRKAVELMGGQSPQLKTGTLSSLLGRYAALLAAQGSLSSAVTYLVDTSEPSLALLQDRIYQCLGLQSPNCPFQHVEIKSAVTSEQQVSQNKQQTQSQVVSQVPTMPQATPYSTQFPSVSSYGYPPSTMTQYQAPAPSSPLGPPMSPVAPPMQQSSQPAAAPPPPPPLSSNQSSLNQPHHISQRYPRHLHDPSVYQDPQYHSNFYSSVQYEYSQNQVPYSQTGYFQPQSVQQSYYNPGQSYGAPGSTYTIANTPASVYQTANYGTSATMPHSSPANPMVLTHSSGGSYEMSKPGWNDPPLLKHTVKQQPSNFEASPITAPIIGGQTLEPLQPPMVSGGGNYMVPSYPPVPDSNPQQLYNPQTQPAPQKTIPEPPKEKGPIPPEHQVLQDIFEDLRNQCQQVATNPQTRRKLDDVARKLENLYDMLRQNALSSGTILGLHQIVQVIQQGDYQTALGVHSQLVSSTNFSETSCFLPGLKVLLQVAQQLSVYLQ